MKRKLITMLTLTVVISIMMGVIPVHAATYSESLVGYRVTLTALAQNYQKCNAKTSLDRTTAAGAGAMIYATVYYGIYQNGSLIYKLGSQVNTSPVYGTSTPLSQVTLSNTSLAVYGGVSRFTHGLNRIEFTKAWYY